MSENNAKTGAAEKPRHLRSGGRVRTEHKRWRKLRLRDVLLLLIPAVAMVAAVIGILYFTRSASTRVLENDACQYYAGRIFRFNEDSVLRRNTENVTVLETGESDEKMGTLPVYYEDRDAITLPEAMSFYVPRTQEKFRVDFFSDLRGMANGLIKVENDDKEKTLPPGFLFDGKDFYLFLEPVTVRFNGYEIELSSMSYVEAVFNGNIMVFNYETKEFTMEPPNGLVTVTPTDGSYTLSLLSDSMTDYDGNKVLLVTKPELLDPIL